MYHTFTLYSTVENKKEKKQLKTQQKAGIFHN